MLVTKHLLFARQEEGSVDQISQEGRSAWQQTARTEATSLPQGQNGVGNSTCSVGGQRRRMGDAIRCGKKGEVEDHRGETASRKMRGGREGSRMEI